MCTKHKVTPEKMKQFLAEAGFILCVLGVCGVLYIPCRKAEKYAVELGDPKLLEDHGLQSIW